MRRILSLLLSAALLAALALPAAAESSFRDLGDTDTAVNADILRLMGVVTGTGDNTFDPSGRLTRAQFCTMVVKFMQKGEDIPRYATRTIFRDVTSRHWALGYVNLAADLTVPGEKEGEEIHLIAGVGDGRFDPDSQITLAQAATILLRVLGYTSKEAGALWPQSYMNLASSIGLLDGITAGSGDPIPRDQAARLFVNALNCKNKAGDIYYTTLSQNVQKNVILLAVDVETDDGSRKGAIRTASGQDVTAYLTASGEGRPTALQGKRGALVLNDKKEIVAFVPDDSESATITLASDAQAAYLAGRDGKRYTISGSTPVYTTGGASGSEYHEAYTSLYTGASVTLFSEQGKIVAIYAEGGVSTGSTDAVVVTGGASSTMFMDLTGGASGYRIQKNRQTITMADIKPYDVVTYDSLTNTLVVSDLRLSCIYEGASPNSQAPEKITVLGHDFPVLESAWETTGNFYLGRQVVLLLTADGRVAGMAEGGNGSDLRSTAVGMAEKGAATMYLPNGGTLSLTGTVPNGEQVANRLVTLSSTQRGTINASRLTGQGTADRFDVAGMRLGSRVVTAGVRIYEQVRGGAMVPIPLDSLDMGTVSGDEIAAYHLNSSGMVDYLVLEDATGDAYRYGMMTVSTETTQNNVPITDEAGKPVEDENGNSTYRTVTHEINTWSLVSSHTVTFGSQYGYIGRSGEFIGIAVGQDRNGVNTILDTLQLNSFQVSSSDFFREDGVDYVRANGRVYRVSDEVECWQNVDSNKLSAANWFQDSTGAARLKACKSSSSHFTVYVDPVGSKVRIVTAD